MNMRKIYILLLLTLLTLSQFCQAQNFPYRHFDPILPMTAEEINCMYFDKEGMMWLGTSAGLKSYDGYTTQTYKSNAYTPNILPTIISNASQRTRTPVFGWEPETDLPA